MATAKRQASFADLNEKIKDRIFKYAGREAIFAYDIATGGRERQKPYIKNNAFYEPFTYWDWHDTDYTYQADDKRKRRLFWDRERGYRVSGGPWSSYPSPLKRWKMFQGRINDDTRDCVKRIALARWMTTEDLKWVCEELPALEELDLSALQTFEGQSPLTDELGEVDWHGIVHLLQNTDTRYPTSDAQPNILPRLKWLGLGNVVRRLKHTPSYVSRQVLKDEGNDPFSTILPLCSKLETLSIRAPYGADSHYWGVQPLVGSYAHQEICKPILRIAQNAPDTVSTLELRQYFDYLPLFLEKLHQFKPSIKRVGIDLGAWIQTFPIRPPLNEEKVAFVTDGEIEENVGKAVDWAAYLGQLEKNQPLTEPPPEAVYNKPASRYLTLEAKQEKATQDNLHLDAVYKQKTNKFYDPTGGTNYPLGLEDDPTHNTAQEYYCPVTVESRLAYNAIDAQDCYLHVHDSEEIIRIPDSPYILIPEKTDVADRNRTNTLPQMLKKLYDLRNCEPVLFALEPEPQNRSNDPVDPLALVQLKEEGTQWGYEEGSGTRYRGFTANDDFTGIYTFLKDRFNWRPVFDWDALVVPEEVAERVDRAFEKMITSDVGKDYLARIAKHFTYLRNANIPVHVLIGRRKAGTSSSYWGYPFDERKWQHWLTRDFDANLDLVVGSIDTLSIYYDLRNPLGEKRLREIEAMQPLRRPHATCPQVPCPWGSSSEPEDNGPLVSPPVNKGDCPFLTQRQPLSRRSVKTKSSPHKKQKMANKSALSSKSNRTQTEYAKLAPCSTTACAPPAGENAHALDSASDVEDSETGIPPLHYLARKAVYTRESLAWQRFWTKYALLFSRLTTLNVRMPAALDDLSIGGSMRLAKVLDVEVGWEMVEFTDERQHVQTKEDLEDSLDAVGGRKEVFEHVPEAPVWTGGRFLRRSWVWPAQRGKWVTVQEGPKRVARFTEVENAKRAKRKFTGEDFKHTENREKVEFDKAKVAVVVAMQRERGAEQRLASKLGPATIETQRRKKLYLDGVVVTAQEKWELLLQRKIEEFQEDLARVEILATDEAGAKSELLNQIQLVVDWLRLRQKEMAPILHPSPDLAGKEEDVKTSLGWKEAKTMEHTWIPQHWFTDIIEEGYGYGLWRGFDVERDVVELREKFLRDICELERSAQGVQSQAPEGAAEDVATEEEASTIYSPQTPHISQENFSSAEEETSPIDTSRVEKSNEIFQAKSPSATPPNPTGEHSEEEFQQGVSPIAQSSILKSVTIVVGESSSSSSPTPASRSEHPEVFTLPGLGTAFGVQIPPKHVTYDARGNEPIITSQDAQLPNGKKRKGDLEVEEEAPAKKQQRKRSSTESTSTSSESSVHDLIQEQLEQQHIVEEKVVQEVVQEVAEEEPGPRKKARMAEPTSPPTLIEDVEESKELAVEVSIRAQKAEPIVKLEPESESKAGVPASMPMQEASAELVSEVEIFVKEEEKSKQARSKTPRRRGAATAYSKDPSYKYNPEEALDDEDHDVEDFGDVSDDDLGDPSRRKGRGRKSIGNKRRGSELEYVPSGEEDHDDDGAPHRKGSKGKGKRKRNASTGSGSKASKKRRSTRMTLDVVDVEGGNDGGDTDAGTKGEGAAPATPPLQATKAAKGGRKKKAVPPPELSPIARRTRSRAKARASGI